MSDARRVADRLTDAVIREDLETVTRCYSPEAVVIAPEGTFKGRDQIAGFFRAWFDPFSEFSVEVGTKAAWGDRALDEWSLSATHSALLEMPTGEKVPSTGRQLTVRGADICTVNGDVITEHHMYYDQAEMLGQLGLLPE